MSRFQQGVIVAFVLGTVLNGWFLAGALSGYTYYVHIYRVTPAGAERYATLIEIGLAIACALVWWLARPQYPKDSARPRQ